MEPAVVGASSGSEADARMKRTLDDLVSKMSTMELSRPEVLRCTYAFQAIRALAVAEKIQSFDAGALYAWSLGGPVVPLDLQKKQPTEKTYPKP